MNDTKIFARARDHVRQYLVYSMSINARDDLAMILPLPVRLPAEESDVEFINLEGYNDFFSDLELGFFAPPLTRGSSVTKGPVAAAMLTVVTVGSFEASFVPSIKDFSRLDRRFRLVDEVWRELPIYKNYGFAVFKLKPGAMTIHPMAFSFPRHDRQNIFFPTVHIHDGRVHEKADFDHVIYCQPRPDELLSMSQWEESYTHPSCFMQVDKTNGIVLPDQHCYKQEMHGLLANRDTFLSVMT